MPERPRPNLTDAQVRGRFANIVEHLHEVPEGEVSVFHRLGAEFNGARGAFADRIASWKQEGGLVREIAIKQQRLRTGDTVGGRDPVRTVMYAMPLNEEHVLLLFPTEDSFDFRIVKPQRSTRSDPHKKSAEDAVFVNGFHAMFDTRDNDEPFVHQSWKVRTGAKPVESFDAHVSRFPVEVVKTFATDKERLINQAEEESRRIKGKRSAVVDSLNKLMDEGSIE